MCRSLRIVIALAIIAAFAVVPKPTVPHPAHAAAHVAPERGWSEDPIGAARVLAADLTRRGKLSVAVDIEPHTLPISAGLARYDFAARRCEVRINPALLARSAFDSFERFRFLVYHELAHCELYARPGGFFAHFGLTSAGARSLDDLVLFDADRKSVV